MDWQIPLFKTYWDDEDVKSVTQAITTGMFWAMGPNIEKFEHVISEYVGTKYVVSFNSGTSALNAVLLAYNIGQDDEVIVPSFTFIATANAPLFVGAKPVFADIEETTYGLDPDSVRDQITPKTRAIIPIHYGGCACLINELKEIAEKNNLILIEDAAEALGASVSGQRTGSFGASAVLSFCSNKVISTGEGGAVTTNSNDIYKKLKLIRSHGRAEDGNYFLSNKSTDYVDLGYNFRVSNIVAALGISQLNKIDHIIKLRQSNAEMLSSELSKIREIEVPCCPDNYFHVYQIYTIRVKDGKKRRDALSAYLAQKGIMTKVYFSPVHLTHFYHTKLGYNEKLPVTEKLSREVLSLPIYPTLTSDEISYVADVIADFFA
ncbi:DegT/DnrJ/EryC1/StrS family aminotransferase [Chloroflexota bacterium]